MSRSTTFTFKVAGDSYEELASKADNIISRFMSSPEEDEFEDDNALISSSSNARVNYEIVVSMSEDISSEYEYQAEVIAKIRD
jgi:hypothetical protein